jgi:iron complex outermembrane receptor protein
MCLPGFLTAQNITAKGKIHDVATGRPIESATVSAKGSRNGTTTDNTGQFSLSVPRGETLEISFVGFETKLYGRCRFFITLA